MFSALGESTQGSSSPMVRLGLEVLARHAPRSGSAGVVAQHPPVLRLGGRARSGGNPVDVVVGTARPPLELGSEGGIVDLGAVGAGRDLPQRRALCRVVEDVQPAVLVERRAAQGRLFGTGHGLVGEGVPVRPSQRHGAQQLSQLG